MPAGRVTAEDGERAEVVNTGNAGVKRRALDQRTDA